jgi:NAD(P)-dependent dehydrogenase (short-subunit alcohol dehydrogenase family)
MFRRGYRFACQQISRYVLCRTAAKPTAEITEEEWDRIITINLNGVFLRLKYEIPRLLQHGGDAIVNTSSGAGIKVFGRGAWSFLAAILQLPDARPFSA